MKRREWLTLIPPSLCLLLIQGCSNSSEKELLKQSISSLKRRKRIAKLGEHYLKQHGAKTESELRSSLLKGISPSSERFFRRLEEKIKQDFHDQNTLTVDGWIVSETEAIFAALVTLQEVN